MSDETPCENPECTHSAPEDYLVDGECLVCSAPSRDGGEA